MAEMEPTMIATETAIEMAQMVLAATWRLCLLFSKLGREHPVHKAGSEFRAGM